MKIQCPCGRKYAFDVTPEMARTPIRFVCPECGRDSSEWVNQLIRQELGVATAPPSAAAPSLPTPVIHVPTPVPAPAANPIRLGALPKPPAAESAQLRTESHTAPVASEPALAPEAPLPCPKHLGQFATHRCLICQKPICPQCMALFGYVCSAYCKGKAEDQGIELPVYAHQKTVVEKKHWRKVGRMVAAITVLVAGVFGAWFWYAWFGSVPKPVFAYRFPEAGYAGQCRLCAQNQIVVLHGGRLSRHDLRAKKEIWSQLLIDKKTIADGAAAGLARLKAAREKAIREGMDADEWRLPSLTELVQDAEKSAAAMLRLHVRGENIWVAFPGKLVHYDWPSGSSTKEIPLADGVLRALPNGDELLMISEKDDGQQLATVISLASGDARTEQIAAPVPPVVVGTGAKIAKTASRRGSNAVPASASLTTNQIAALVAASKSGRSNSKPLDPSAVAAKAQNLTLPSRLALPAVLAANANQQRLLQEMRGQAERAAPPDASQRGEVERATVMPAGSGFVQFSVKLLESKIVEREAMKAPPKKSALEGDINSAATSSIANEILNDMQRDRAGSTVQEDVSRYQVTLRRPGAKEVAEWTGEVIGPPELFPLQSVDVLVAGKTVLVFNKANQKVWENKLSYPVAGGLGADASDGQLSLGQGPCVERGDTLYLFDQGMLSSFELATGNRRWSLPSVGVSGLHFDDQGKLYVNTTTASPDSIKYSRQIDISERTGQLVLKLNAKTGKLLWKAEKDGWVNYVSGKFIYTVQSFEGEDPEADGALSVPIGLQQQPFVRLKRLDAGNGQMLWEYFQPRAPLDVQFEKNTIGLLFKKEIQVLKFISL